MMAKGNKGLLLVLGKGKPQEAEEEGQEDGAKGEAMVDAMGQLIDAVKAGDKKAAAVAFADAMTLCQEGYADEGEDEKEVAEEA